MIHNDIELEVTKEHIRYKVGKNMYVNSRATRCFWGLLLNGTLGCVGLIVLILMFTDISNAKIDPKTIVGMWLFDEGKGDKALDSSESGNDGKLENEPKWATGKFGQALEFDGEKGYVDVGNLGLSGAVTLVFWAKPDSAINDDRLISNTTGLTNPAFTIRFQGGGVEVWSTAWKQVIAKFDNNKWGHYAFVFDDSGGPVGNATGYYNGVEGSTVSDPYIFTDIGIGANFLDTWGQYFKGVLDGVAFFNIALTHDDINNVMTKGLKSAAAVSPTGKLATNWGTIKAQY